MSTSSNPLNRRFSSTTSHLNNDRQPRSIRQSPGKPGIKLLIYAAVFLVMSGLAILFTTLYESQRAKVVHETSMRDLADKRLREIQELHLATLVGVARQSVIDPLSARQRATTAQEFARSEGLDLGEVDSLLRSLPTQHEVPSSCTLEIIQARRSEPIAYLDVSITNQGVFVPSLERQDFELYADDQRLRYLTVSQRKAAEAKLSVAVLLDCSSSTQGEPFRQELEAAARFCETMTASASLRIWSFASEAAPVTSWTTDSKYLSNAIMKLQSNGSTAMHSALLSACKDLSGRGGEKAIVLFTDGRNSDGNSQLQSVILQAQEHRIRIFTVGLKTSDIDETSLVHISNETQGSHSLISDPGKIHKSFDLIAESINRPFYRIVVIDRFEDRASLTIRVGNCPAQMATLRM